MPSAAGWDASNTGEYSVLLRATGDTLDMWYDGNGLSFPYSIGHATSPLVTTAVSGRDREVPKVFMLEQNYPNRFNPTTVVRYQLPAPSGVEGPVVSDVRLAVYDLLGREVAVLVNERKSPGSYEVKFDAAGRSSGVYLYRLTAGNFVQTRKMVVVK